MNSGMELAEALLKDPVIKPRSVMWVYDESASEWRFLVATNDVNKRGPQAAYLRIRNVLKRTGLASKIPLRRIVVSSPSQPLIEMLARTFYVQENRIGRLSILDCTFDGMHIPGAYVYVLNGSACTPDGATKAAAENASVAR